MILITPSRFGLEHEGLRLALEEENIEARPGQEPMHLQPIDQGSTIRGRTVSTDLFEPGLCLPSGTQLDEEDLNRITGIIKKLQRAK